MTPLLRRAVVQLSGERCGVLEELEGQRSRFRYDDDWLARRDRRAVSLTLPLREAPFESTGLPPFFANLLPEGWLLDVSLARLKIARDDAFGLLLATCRDCMGEVEIVPDGATP
jgi:serine/threonine-protein kinase HipA